MKIAVYARTSTVEKQDLDTQLLPLRSYAMRCGFTVYKEYTDKMSGGKESRPALDELMEDAKKRKFDAVLVFRFDRFSRSTRQLINTLDTFNHLGIDFILYNENIDTSSPAGKVLFTMISAFSEFEKSIIQERVRAGLEKARKKGKVLGRPKVNIDMKKVEKYKNEGMSLQKIADKMKLKKSNLYSKYKEYKLQQV